MPPPATHGLSHFPASHPARLEADRLARAAPRNIPFSAASLGAQARLLTLLGSDAPLPMLLDALASCVETWAQAMWCSILIRDPAATCWCRAPRRACRVTMSMPLGVVQISENVGSCGTAAARREPVSVPDIRDSRLWRDYRALAEDHGLRACWSVPFLDDSGEVLGRLAQYYPTPREPSADEQEREHHALDLHDDVGQRLVGIEWLLAAEASRAGPERAGALRELQALVSGLQRDVGTLATWMLPLARHRTGLTGALRDLVRHTGALADGEAAALRMRVSLAPGVA